MKRERGNDAKGKQEIRKEEMSRKVKEKRKKRERNED